MNLVLISWTVNFLVDEKFQLHKAAKGFPGNTNPKMMEYFLTTISFTKKKKKSNES